MNLFEEAQEDMRRAAALEDHAAVARIAHETLAAAVGMGMDDLAEILQECLERGRYADMQSVLHAMSAKEHEWDADRDAVMLSWVKENGAARYQPNMN